MGPKHNRRLVDPVYEEELGFSFFLYIYIGSSPDQEN